MSVKTYAELVDKSDKTIYKQIKNGSLEAVRVKKGYQVCVDANMLKRLKKLSKALDEARTALKSAKEDRNATSEKKAPAPTAPKKNAPQRRVKTLQKKSAAPTANRNSKKAPLKKRK